MALKHLYIYLVITVVLVIAILVYVGISKVPADTQSVRCDGAMMRGLEEQLANSGDSFDSEKYEQLQNELQQCRDEANVR